jgi:hypothetical protein
MQRTKIYGPSKQLIDLGPDKENLVPIAQDIAILRGRAVAETMFHIAAIRSLQPVSAGSAAAHVTCQAAHVQSCSATEGQQAAHLLPGQILIGGHPVWALAATTTRELHGDVDRLKQQTMLCFALTNVLPALFNRADSEAEGTGATAAVQTLKPLFGEVVGSLWRGAHVHPARPLVIDRAAVDTALQRWFREVSAVYRDAAGRKAARQRLDEARVLTTYADSFQVANVMRFVTQHLPQVYQRYSFIA